LPEGPTAPAAAAWMTFFKDLGRRDDPDAPVDDATLKRDWGNAEKAAVHAGLDMAKDVPKDVVEDALIKNFTAYTDQYRSALINGTTLDGGRVAAGLSGLSRVPSD